MNPLNRERYLGVAYLVIATGLVTGAFVWLAFEQNFMTFTFGFILGSLVAVLFVLYNENLKPLFSKLNLFLSLFINFVIYLFIILFASFGVMTLLYGIDFHMVFDNFIIILLHENMIYGYVFGVTISLLFNFNSLFNTLLGRNFLLNILIGKYKKPFQEERAFMFIDLKSSTTIAEDIGHEKYLLLLNDFFLDLAEPVLKSKGEIYKYVGDEAIITWRYSRIRGSVRPLDCYFQFEEKIDKNAKHYLKNYHTIPSFKAGLHGGKVVAGEMGQIKKEIAFIGDVLNTTSRIEASCNEFGVDLLVSGEILEILDLSGKYQPSALGEVIFRGKSSSTEIFTINKI